MSLGRLPWRIVCFPVALFDLFRWPTRRWRGGAPSGPSRFGWALVDIAIALLLVVPASLLVLMELLIGANRIVVGENLDYRIPSDFETGVSTLAALPGAPEPVAPDLGPDLGPDLAPDLHPDLDLDSFRDPGKRRALALHFAPVLLLETSYRPAWDLPVAIDFDGNWEPRDNPESLDRIGAPPAVIYGELTAVTEDALYFTYTLYRVRDYDHPVRQWVSRSTHHDSDNEGFHLRVDRGTGRAVSVETWFHNRFLVCNRSGVSTGTESVSGRLHLEGHRPVIFSQSQGHGVRCAQSADVERIDRLKVLRPAPDGRADSPRADRSAEHALRYRLEGFERWYAEAARPDERPLFSGSLELGPELRVGRFISGLDREAVGLWSRPKPMWAWDDGWDGVPVAVWHFLPSSSFESHEGGPLSHDYLFNAPAQAIFGLSGNELQARMDVVPERREGEKWGELETRGDIGRHTYWNAAGIVLGRYVTRVFMALG